MSTSEVVAPPQAGVGARRGSGLRWRLALLGPAFVAAVAYVDPGNFATNSTAGATYGYLLVWVVLAANVMAMVVQTLSAKLGLATGMSLPEVCRQRCSPWTARLMWAQAELVAAATDVAEVIGGAVGLHLLFGLDLLPAGLIVGAASFALLTLRSRGYRRFEVTIMVMLLAILVAFLVTICRSGVDLGAAAAGTVPRFAGPDSVLLAAGILGATVMPHVVYVHSALTTDRYEYADDEQLRRAGRAQRMDVLLALGCAGVVNLAMLLVAAGVFHGSEAADATTLEGVHAGLGAELGAGAAVLYGVALLLSGLASTSVGTYAGDIIMAGYLRRQIPLALRRLVTLTPALIILAVGIDPTTALVLSQVVLSFGIPFALIPLVWWTRRRDVMGVLVNRGLTTVAACAVAAVVIVLNIVLLSRLG
ncbi:Nramp family divalent metal transporter [Micromonospora zamorensis]|uniref:Nramp family divalent metal transporter n=1 Tax=Micromonospora zamorensis TaxID=709883 RepID=UPI000C19E6C6|nr:Nramp family divalent metal transporter [Micromonospora zamorensis]WSK49759.1 Nramp family divalent metal transporter [Micromonospora zamorensis]